MNKEDDMKIVGKTDVGGRTGWDVTVRENGS